MKRRGFLGALAALVAVPALAWGQTRQQFRRPVITSWGVQDRVYERRQHPNEYRAQWFQRPGDRRLGCQWRECQPELSTFLEDRWQQRRYWELQQLKRDTFRFSRLPYWNPPPPRKSIAMKYWEKLLEAWK